MSRKIYLSTYVVSLKDKEFKENTNLSSLKGSFNFAQLFEGFVYDIASLPFKQSEIQKISRTRGVVNTKSLGMKSPFVFTKDDELSEMSGLMSSGISGREYPVHDIDTGEYLYDRLPNHAGMLDTFFKIKLFENRKYAFLVLERQGEFGIKKIFTRAFQDFLVKQNLGKKYDIIVENFLIGRVFESMLSNGRIFEVNFTKNVVQDNVAQQFDRGHRPVVGSTKTTITAGRGVNLPLKGLAMSLFRRPRENDRDGRARVEGYDEFDEVSFELDINGTRKTIHMVNVGRSMPDYDVSDVVDYNDTTGEPTIESLNREADVLIRDMLTHYDGSVII